MSGPIVGSVLITFDFKVIQDLFFANASLEDIKGNSNTFLFSNKRDNTFLRFKHSLGIESKTQDIQLEFIDPSRDFEKVFVDRSLFQIIKNLATEVTQEVNEAELSNKIPLSENFKPDTTIAPTIVTASRIPSTQDVKTYITYGVGSDHKKWAGPFSMDFIGADLRVDSEGTRVLTVRFVPSMNPLTTTQGIYGQSLPDESSDQGIKRVSAIVPLDLGFPQGSLSKGIDLQKSFKFHPILKECITEYLQKSSASKQVIVLLPDIDKTQTTWLETKRKETPAAELNFLEKIFVQLKPDVFGGNTRVRSEQELKELNQSLAVNDYITKVLANFGIKVGGKLEEYIRKSPGVHSKMRSENQLPATPVAVMESDPPGEDGIIDYKEPIHRFMNGYNDSVYYSENIVFWQESNLNVLNIWKQYKLIEDATRPVMVFGDKRLIEILLYGLFISLTEQDAVAISDMNKEDFLEIYRGEGFLKEVQLVVIPKGEDIYNYGETDFDEDILAITRETAKLFSVPIFRTNVKNPNILEYNVKMDNSYFSNLMMSMNLQSTYSNMQTEIIEKKTAEETYDTWMDLEGIIKRWKEAGKDDVFIESKLTGRLEQYGRLYPAEIPKVAKLALSIYMKMQNSNLPKMYVDERTGKNPLNVQLEIFHQLLSLSWQINLKTLPYFKISSAHHINYPAVIIGKQPLLVGTGTEPEFVDSFFTGLYFINGFNHVISNDGIYSEFIVTKYLKSSSSQQDTGGGTELNTPIESSLLRIGTQSKRTSISDVLDPNKLFK